MYKTLIIGLIFNILFINSSYALNRKELEPKAKKEILAVYEKNNELFNAYFDYDPKKVEKLAGELKDTIGKVSNQSFVKQMGYGIKKLEQIKASNEREKNNKAYHLVSMALIYMLKKFDLGDQYNAYSCPMVKMKWIQDTKKKAKVHNPYAPWMPHCGEQDTNFK